MTPSEQLGHTWGKVECNVFYKSDGIIKYRICKNNCGCFLYHFCAWHGSDCKTCKMWKIYVYNINYNKKIPYHYHKNCLFATINVPSIYAESPYFQLSCSEIIIKNIL